MLRALLVLSLTLPAACVDLEDPGDGRDDSFARGKADSALSSAETAAVLRLVNRAGLAELDHEVPLDARAAAGIVGHRAGADGALDTADDDLFDTLAELDAVPWVGPRALERLLDYALLHDGGGAGAAPCVIISEYVEKWGNYNKALELYNCGTEAVDRAAVELCLVRNGDDTCSRYADLGEGTLAPGAVLTVCRRTAYHEASLDPVPALAQACDLERSAVTTFDGDDRLMVLDRNSGAVLDALGRFGYRPPSGTWSEVILRRCNLAPADGVSFYDHRDYFVSLPNLDLSGFGRPPADPACN